MKKKFDFKKLLTATNFLFILLILFYLFDKFLPLPQGYTGFTAWDADEDPVFNYIFGNCGGLLTNYMALSPALSPYGAGIYRRLTTNLLHGNILHLIANLAGLYFIGNHTEKKFGWWLTYLLFFVIAFIESYITDPLYLAFVPDKKEEILTLPRVGASSGIFGLAGVSLAALLFDVKQFKKIGLTTIVVSAVYGVFTTWIVSFGWTTVCHNVALTLGLAIGAAIILPFFIIKRKKAAAAYASIEYLELTAENFNSSSLDGFIRRQKVTRCWRLYNGEYKIKPVKYVEDWNAEQLRVTAEKILTCVDKGGKAYGALLNREIIGFALISNELCGSKKQYAVLEELYVSAPHRNRGVGKKLFKLACDGARSLGAEKLYISAHSAKESIAAYKNLGCVFAEEINGFLAEKEPCDLQLEFILK